MQKVLLVDDSAVFLRIVANMLKEKFEVVGTAQDGAQGFQMFSDLRPDLVIMDITMPQLSGKDCLAKIMALDAKARVVMLSSLNDEQTSKECLALGAKAFVNKSAISIGDLKSNVQLEAAIQLALQGPQWEAV